MVASYALFFFVVFGSKVVLAAITIFLLLPTDPRCPRCDADTLLLRMGGPGRLAARLLRGRLQRRWCPHCGWQGMGRVDRRRRREAAFRIRVREPHQKTAEDAEQL